MTRYTVVWDDDAEAVVLSAWIAGDSTVRATLTSISDWIDANLATDADVKGVAVPAEMARAIDTPLRGTSASARVIFQVSPDDRQVRVIRITVRSSE